MDDTAFEEFLIRWENMEDNAVYSIDGGIPKDWFYQFYHGGYMQARNDMAKESAGRDKYS